MKSNLRALCAAGAMFTRLPFWRLMRLEKEDYQQALDWWPVVGLLTGSVVAWSFCFASKVFPISMAVILAIASRLVLTGGFHEDGLGDFFDGFGAGGSKERILTIMKDSHVGSYAVLGYIIYYGLLWQAYTHLAIDAEQLFGVMIYTDVVGKWVSSLQVQWLPYARDEETSKTGIIYLKAWGIPRFIGIALVLLLPLILGLERVALGILDIALLVGLGLMWYIKRKIGGYTGDTCGAISLLVELTAVLATLALI